MQKELKSVQHGKYFRVEASPLKIDERYKVCGEFEKKCKMFAQCDECGKKNF